MPNSFVEVTRKGWGSRIMSSFMGVVFGIALFLGSFVLLYWNEGRVDLSRVAMKALPVRVEAVDATANGKLVSVTGKATTEESVGDGIYLKPGNWIAVERKVEMYAWEETKTTKSQTNVGGSETETTTYTYNLVWTENPESSGNFRQPAEHENPGMSIESGKFRVASAKVGAYDLAIGEITLPESRELVLDASLINVEGGVVDASAPNAAGSVEGGVVEGSVLAGGVVAADSKYLFKGQGTLGGPQVGDLRISYFIVPNDFDATAFGKLEGKTIRPFLAEKGAVLHRLFYGSRDSAIQTMSTEFKVLTWVLRGVGFLMMFIGLAMIFGPVSVFLDVLPIFGSISRFAVGGLAFVVSLVLSLVTIFVSMLFHSLMAVFIVVVGISVALVIWILSKRKRASAIPS